MRIQRPIAASVAIISLLPGVCAAAETTTQQSSSGIEEIIVTATPLGASELHLAQPVTVLTAEELKNRVSSSIGETLSRELGIAATSFGAGASRPVIRAQSGSRVKVLDSGVSSMDLANLSPDHAVTIDPIAATQIEVLKGPATLLYGSGATGGVVNVVTNRVPQAMPESPALRARLQSESANDARDGAFSADAGAGAFAFHADGAKRNTGDYRIPDYGNRVPEPGDRHGRLSASDLQTDSLFGGASYIGSGGNLGFDVGRYQTNYGVPGEGARIKMHEDRYDVKGALHSPLSGVEKLKLQVGHVDYDHTEFEPNGEAGTTFLNDEYEGRVELVHAPIAGWHGAFGTQIDTRQFEATGEEALTPPLDIDSQGLFVVEEHDIGDDWHLEFGARVEHQHIDPAGGVESTDHDTWSVSGGTIWRFAADHALAFNVSHAQRAPSFEELYNHGPHPATATYEVGDIDLDPESANNLDITLRRDTANWSWQINLFANYIEDYIFDNSVDLDGDGVADRVDEEGEPTTEDESLLYVQYAQADAKFYGFEAGTNFALARCDFGDIDGRLSWDYVRGELDDGDNLPRITPMRLGAGVDYKFNEWAAVVDVFHVFEQDDTAALETETGSYTLLEASLSYTLKLGGGEYELALRGRNLLDEEARVHTSFLKDVAPLPGRSVIASVEATF